MCIISHCPNGQYFNWKLVLLLSDICGKIWGWLTSLQISVRWKRLFGNSILDCLVSFILYFPDICFAVTTKYFLILGSYKIPDYIPKQAIKELQLMDQEIFRSESHAIFRKSSPFLLKYNQLVRRLAESGIIYHMREQVWHWINYMVI